MTKTLDLEALVLAKGNHQDRSNGLCVMEAVAWMAGEKHSDHPKCACQVISAFLRRWNDDMDDAGRQRLKPYIPKLVGTKSTREVEQCRAWLLTDWAVRVSTPAWRRLAGMDEQAAALEALPEIADLASAQAGQKACSSARSKAYELRQERFTALRKKSAAYADAAFSYAADAYADDAYAAERKKVYDAVYAAVNEKLAPTKLSLQDSALLLLDRLIALGQKPVEVEIPY